MKILAFDIAYLEGYIVIDYTPSKKQIRITESGIINVKKYKSAPASVSAFYNDINKNKNTYNIDLVTNTKKFIVIKFR